MLTTPPTLAAPPLIVPPARSRRSLWLAALIGGVGLAYYYFFNPSEQPLLPACQFYQLTGILCPGCGGQRALHLLLHGEVLAAFHHNALLVLSLPLLGFLALRLIARRQLPALANPQLWLGTLFTLLIVFTILRNLPGAGSLRP